MKLAESDTMMRLDDDVQHEDRTAFAYSTEVSPASSARPGGTGWGHFAWVDRDREWPGKSDTQATFQDRERSRVGSNFEPEDHPMRRANVYYRDNLAGVLSQDSGGYVFEYLPAYLANPALPAISLTFPKREAVFQSPVLFPFFFGLLAEGENKLLAMPSSQNRRGRPLHAPAADLRDRNDRRNHRQGDLMTNCPGCLKEGHSTYCQPCRKRFFGGKKVSHVLPFSRPVYKPGP